MQAFRARPAPAPDTAPKGSWLARRRSRKRTAEEDTPAPDVVRDHSVWWGTDGAALQDVTLDAANDLAVGRLRLIGSIEATLSQVRAGDARRMSGTRILGEYFDVSLSHNRWIP